MLQAHLCIRPCQPTHKDLYRTAEVFVEQFIASYEMPQDAIVLNIDDTVDITP